VEHERADVARFARGARRASLRAVVLLGGELTKPSEDRRGPDDLAAGPALRGGQVLARERQAAALLGAEVDPRLAARCRHGFLENADLLLQVVEAPHHP